LRATNVTRGLVLVSDGRKADRPWSRVRGLIGSAPLVTGDGLWIVPCNGIHTWFMSFPIDAVYLDRDSVVVAVDEGMAPWRIGHFVKGARSVLELPAGTIGATGTQVGDRIILDT